jgi:hypothetical protein
VLFVSEGCVSRASTVTLNTYEYEMSLTESELFFATTCGAESIQVVAWVERECIQYEVDVVAEGVPEAGPLTAVGLRIAGEALGQRCEASDEEALCAARARREQRRRPPSRREARRSRADRMVCSEPAANRAFEVNGIQVLADEDGRFAISNQQGPFLIRAAGKAWAVDCSGAGS